MAQDTTPAIVVYRGNGDNSVPYDVPFDKGYYGEVKVAFIRRGLDDYTYEPDPSNYTVNGRLYAWFSGTGYVYTHTPNPAVSADIYNNFDEPTGETVSAVAGQTITVNSTIYSRATQHDIANQLLLTWTGTVLTSDDFICIVRDTERGQPYIFPNNQKHIENALDNIERQIQENKSKLDNALLVDPAHTIDTSKMAPLDWMKSIVRCVDFSVRALRYANGWLDYSLDDPNIADGDKTWTRLLNTDNIKAIRERSDIVDGVTIYWTEYQASDGTWRTLANTSEWERRIQYAIDTADDAKAVADDAKDIAQDAKDIAQDAKDIADTFDDRLTQAEQDAGDAKDMAQDTSDTVSAHIADTDNPHSVTATQIGLGNCDNTADLDKPISTATQTALDTKATPADITSAISTHNADSSAHSNIISPIQEVIPTAATSSNQLADKNFVNSSIATSTAVFRGTYNSLAELEAQTADENDYGFVVSTDAAGNTIYNRYKYTTATTPASWVFEYALNNSSFTATQWDAINSGANTTNIGQIATNTSAISSHTGNTSNPHSVTKAQVGLGNVDNTSDADKPISTATQTALDGKQSTLTAGSNITIAGTTISATDTTYTGSGGITLTGTNFTNSGVRAVASGTANGTISVNTNGTSADVAVTGLGSAAYTASTDYATSAQGGKADTAVQPADLATVATTGDYDDLLNKPTIPAAQVNSDWDAVSGVAQILNKPTIPTVNDATITITQGGVTKGSFTLNQASGDTIALDAGGGSIDAIDNLTITKNGSDEIQAVATVNANTAVGATNPVYDWVGTLAEYTAQDIENQHPDWICYITDDVSGGASVYTKTEVDNIASTLVHLAGNETITGTKSFSSVAYGTPSDANNSIVTTSNKSKGQNGYFKFGNGLIIQWGTLTTTGADSRAVTFPVAFSSANSYSVTINPKGASTTAIYTIAINNYTTTGFTAYSGGNVRNFQAFWIAIGY